MRRAWFAVITCGIAAAALAALMRPVPAADPEDDGLGYLEPGCSYDVQFTMYNWNTRARSAPSPTLTYRFVGADGDDTLKVNLLGGVPGKWTHTEVWRRRCDVTTGPFWFDNLRPTSCCWGDRDVGLIPDHLLGPPTY